MRTDKYLQIYKYIYEASVFHDETFNEGKLDAEWAHQFARTIFALNHQDGATKEEIEEFMNGWYDFWYHMFD